METVTALAKALEIPKPLAAEAGLATELATALPLELVAVAVGELGPVKEVQALAMAKAEGMAAVPHH